MLEKENLFVNSYSPPSCIAKKFQQTDYSQGLSNGGYRKDYEQMQQMFLPKSEQLLSITDHPGEPNNCYGMKPTEVSNGWHEEKLVDWNDSIEQLLKTTERSLNNNNKSIEETSLNNEAKCRNYHGNLNYENIPFWSSSRTDITDDILNSSSRINSNIKNPKALVFSIREHLASYQESNGIPRTEYPFTDLVVVMGQATARSLVALLYVVINIAPIAELFLYILRFILDKLISIRNTSDSRQLLVKYAIFAIQLLSIYVCLTFIFGFIVLPILYMVILIVAKILSYNY